MLQLTEGDDPDLILSITTAVGQASIRGIRDKSVPVIFAGVVDPVVAGIVPGWEGGSETHAGASMLPDMHASLSFVKQVVPDAERIGTLFNPGEDNDITNIEFIEAAGEELGLEIVPVAVDNANDLPQRVQSFAGQVDAIYLIQSNVVQTSVPVVAQIAQRIGLPLFNSVYSDELKNELAGFHAINYERNGVHAADIAHRVLQGEAVEDIAVYVPDETDFISRVSPEGLAAVGLSVPAALEGSDWIIE
jgi:putative ABC transport system substrate-binding protein